MKKSFYAIGIATLFIASQAVSQISQTALLTHSPSFKQGLVGGLSETNLPTIVEEKLRKEFSNINDVEWVETPDGYRVYFVQDAFLTAADYTRKGKLYSTIRYGNELLSASDKRQINVAFDEPEVRQVSEVKMAGFRTKVYIVIVEDESSVKTVQLIEGNLKVINEQLKKY